MAKRTSRSSANDSSAPAPTESSRKPRATRAKAAASDQPNGAPAERLTAGVDQSAEALSASAVKTPGAAFQPTEDEIRHRAYLRFLERGGAHGADFDDWLHAERELLGKRDS